MGGEARLTRQRDRGRLNARERVMGLFDPGSFFEIGQLVGTTDEPPVPGDALVAGSGLINGRPALAGAEDVTVLGGSIGSGAADKRYRLCQLALQERVPLVMMLEGAGHRVTDAAAGPPLVKSATGEDVTKEALGGPHVAADAAGVVQNVVADDIEAIDLARRYLDYFPLNAWDRPPYRPGPHSGPRRLEDILELIPPSPRQPYPIGPLLQVLVDEGSLLEIQPTFGRSIVTALARLGGQSVAIVANDPSVMAGTIDSAAAEKVAHFLDVVGAFGLPCIFLADNPGVLAGTVAERQGILRHSARMFAMQHRLTAPKLHVTLRKAFGFGSSVMAMNPFDGQTITLAFPSITLGALPALSEASAVDDPGERARLAAQQAEASVRAAGRLAYDAVIDPRDLRNALLSGLSLAEGRQSAPRVPRGTGILP
jgi:acetyl-CoA carboxylase carboxyltransferase component